MKTRFPKQTAILLIGYFHITKVEENYRVFFPDDCPYAGKFFYIPEEYTSIYEDRYEVILERTYMMPVFSMITNTFMEISWQRLCFQIEKYNSSKRSKEKNDYENYEKY